MPALECPELIPDPPNEGCFLCHPEPWRVILRGSAVQLVAGLGALCEGYVLVAPIDHVATSADLDSSTLKEFLAFCELTKDALASQYGPGFTAYEHAKIGSCRVAENKGDFDHFCFHCHRVFIPRNTDITSAVAQYFNDQVDIRHSSEIKSLADRQYVYYESGKTVGASVARAFVEERQVPSQFMRRMLAPVIAPKAESNWAADYNLAAVIRTVTSLRTELTGLSDCCAKPIVQTQPEIRRPQLSLSIDGLSATGKTSLAMAVAARLSARVVDSGLILRRLAAVELGATDPSDTELESLLLTGDPGTLPRGIAAADAVRRAARDTAARQRMRQAVLNVLDCHGSCIVLGREAWQMVPDAAVRMLITADFPIRVRRMLLDACGRDAPLPNIAEISESLRHTDEHDKRLLPPLSAIDFHIDNGRRPFSVVVEELLLALDLETP